MKKTQLNKYWKKQKKLLKTLKSHSFRTLKTKDYINRFISAQLRLRELKLKIPPSRRLIRPSRLKPGDTIGIVAWAWSFDIGKFRKGVEKLKELGFKVKYSRTIFSTYWSMAGYDKERAGQINQMFADKQVKANLMSLYL